MILRRESRSASTPTIMPSTGNGKVSNATKMPTWAADACSVKTASVGSANAVSAVPTRLTVCPAQSLLNSDTPVPNRSIDAQR